MKKHFTTHLVVLMQTFPELKVKIESLIPCEFSEDNLVELMDSPIYGVHIKNMINIINSHSIAFNKVNLTIQHVNKLIDDISNIEFEHLSEPQRDRLPVFAKEIDQLNDYIGNELVEMVNQDREEVVKEIEVRSNESQAYIKELQSNLGLLLQHLNKEFDLQLEWTEGRSINTWSDLEDWQRRLAHVNQKHIAAGNAKKENIIDFLRAVVITEALANLYTSTVMTEKAVVDEKMVKKMIKYIGKVDLDRFIFSEREYSTDEIQNKVDASYDKMHQLEVEMKEYPVKDSGVSDDDKKEFERLVSTDRVFTQVGGNTSLGD